MSPGIAPFIFFFYCSGHHRDLHSFPTRRSSDLSPRNARPPPPTAPENRTSRGAAISSRRSEEHTSELQSRYHLVCRLLLEKKKRAWRYSRVLSGERRARAKRLIQRGKRRR